MLQQIVGIRMRLQEIEVLLNDEDISDNDYSEYIIEQFELEELLSEYEKELDEYDGEFDY